MPSPTLKRCASERRVLQFTALLLSATLVCAQSAPVATLSLRVVDGAGAVVAPGAVSGRTLTVEVDDADGKPVDGATVIYRLPKEGPSGVFASGLTFEALTTAADGRATVSGIRFNTTPGAVQVAITGRKDGREGSVTLPLEISDEAHAPAEAKETRNFHGPSSGKKWIWLAVAAAGGLGAAAAMKGGAKSAAVLPNPTSPVVTPAVSAPLITVGKP